VLAAGRNFSDCAQGQAPITVVLRHTSTTTKSGKDGKVALIMLILICRWTTNSTTGNTRPRINVRGWRRSRRPWIREFSQAAVGLPRDREQVRAVFL
jgi:hypothetical protein